MNWESIITPVIASVALAGAGAIGKVLVAYINSSRDLVIEKIGAERYNRAREFAKGLFVLLEDEFKDASNAGNKKRLLMEEELRKKFPSLSQAELDAINKEVWNTFREIDKILDSEASDKSSDTLLG